MPAVIKVLWFLMILQFAQSITFCNNGQQVSLNSSLPGVINSNLQDEVYYGNNRRCVWEIEAQVGSRVQLTVVRSDIQWAPSVVAVCEDGYDYMMVENVYPNSTSSKIVTWCGRTNPGSIISTSSKVRITFHTNHQNIYNYRGILLEYTSFTQCPVNWTEHNDHCYFLHPASLTWKLAQQHCGYSQANLVTITSETERDFVLSLGTNSLAWIGLNDIKHEGEYRWIDGTSQGYNAWTSSHKSRPDRDCVSMDNKGSWKEERCNELDERRFICEMLKDGVTHVYAVPQADTDKGRSDNVIPSWFQWQVFVPCMVVLIVIIIVVTVLLIRKRKRERSKRDLRAYENRNENIDMVPPPGVAQTSSTRATNANARSDHSPRTTSNAQTPIGGASSHSVRTNTNTHQQRSPANRPHADRGIPPHAVLSQGPIDRPATYSPPPPSYDDATRDTSSGGDGTHVHVHVHLPHVKSHSVEV